MKVIILVDCDFKHYVVKHVKATCKVGTKVVEGLGTL